MDGTGFSGDLVAWTIIEPSVYFISVCLVTYRPLLTNLIEFVGVKSSQLRGTSRISRITDAFETEKDTVCHRIHSMSR
jgi:hypothetical protein